MYSVLLLTGIHTSICVVHRYLWEEKGLLCFFIFKTSGPTDPLLRGNRLLVFVLYSDTCRQFDNRMCNLIMATNIKKIWTECKFTNYLHCAAFLLIMIIRWWVSSLTQSSCQRAHSHWAICTMPEHIWLTKSSFFHECERSVPYSSTARFVGPGMVVRGGLQHGTVCLLLIGQLQDLTEYRREREGMTCNKGPQVGMKPRAAAARTQPLWMSWRGAPAMTKPWQKHC